MAQIGYTGGGGFLQSTSQRQVHACKFQAPSTFTPTQFFVNFSEDWGQAGTVYIAIYNDNAGAVGTKLWNGSSTYSALHTGWKQITMSSPPSLTSGTNYWLCVYFEKDSGGTYNVNFSLPNDSSSPINRWTESTAGTWTDNPTIASTVNDRLLRIYATDLVTYTKTHTTNTLLKKSATKTHTVNSLIKKGQLLTHTIDSFLRSIIGKPTWVSPSDGATGVLASEPLVFTIPTSELDMHFEIQYDTVNTFDSVDLKTHKSWENQTGWEYYNGSSWVAVPSTGIPTSASGNQARYTPTDLTQTTWYRRIRGRGKNIG